VEKAAVQEAVAPEQSVESVERKVLGDGEQGLGSERIDGWWHDRTWKIDREWEASWQNQINTPKSYFQVLSLPAFCRNDLHCIFAGLRFEELEPGKFKSENHLHT
jgi:hypothetical protein